MNFFDYFQIASVVIVLGVFLINGTLIFLIFAALAVAVLHWQILQEEEFLLGLYGQPYQSYRAKTGRYLYW